ncbi:MAG: hypothetical protein MJK12_01845 [Colwellia sp.]|nr:hypothetical protein [Colwellia sp.]
MTTEHIPSYLAGADGDPLMIGIAITLIVMVLIGGVLYFKLHAVPEHIAHGKNHTQIQLISILTILALFTHNNVFWVAALVVAVIKLPDFLSPLKSIARSLSIIAKNEKAKLAADVVDKVDTKEEC